MISEELKTKLKEMEENGRYFITISTVKKDEKDNYDFEHYFYQENFPDKKVVHCLDSIAKDFNKNKGSNLPWE